MTTKKNKKQTFLNHIEPQKRLLLFTFTLPLIALAVAQWGQLSSFTQIINVLAVSLAVASCLAYSLVIQKSFPVFLMVFLITLFLRAGILAYLASQAPLNFEQSLLACSFVVGYHFVEIALVAREMSQRQLINGLKVEVVS